MSDLAATQRRLARLLAAPSGVRAALAERGDPEGASLRDLVRGDARLGAAERLEVYANAYFHRIHDALLDDHGALAAALGPEGFHDLVTAYLMVHPPEQPSLRDAGARLPRFLEGDPAAEPFRRRWRFAPDLARLEKALLDAFDAPDAAPLARAELERLPPEAWEALPLRLHPSARLVPVRHPVAAVRAAFEEAGAEAVRAPEAPEPGTLLVWRRAERVRFRALEEEEARLLGRLREGERFGALCEHLAAEAGAEDAPALAAAHLAAWIDAELLVHG